MPPNLCTILRTKSCIVSQGLHPLDHAQVSQRGRCYATSIATSGVITYSTISAEKQNLFIPKALLGRKSTAKCTKVL